MPLAGGQVAQWLAHRIVLLMMKIVGGSNPTVSSLVDRSECISRACTTRSRVGIRDYCARNMPKHTPQYNSYMGPHHMHTKDYDG
jgi:hypothetical protein